MFYKKETVKLELKASIIHIVSDTLRFLSFLPSINITLRVGNPDNSKIWNVASSRHTFSVTSIFVGSLGLLPVFYMVSGLSTHVQLIPLLSTHLNVLQSCSIICGFSVSSRKSTYLSSYLKTLAKDHLFCKVNIT